MKHHHSQCDQSDELPEQDSGPQDPVVTARRRMAILALLEEVYDH